MRPGFNRRLSRRQRQHDIKACSEECEVRAKEPSASATLAYDLSLLTLPYRMRLTGPNGKPIHQTKKIGKDSDSAARCLGTEGNMVLARRPHWHSLAQDFCSVILEPPGNECASDDRPDVDLHAHCLPAARRPAYRCEARSPAAGWAVRSWRISPAAACSVLAFCSERMRRIDLVLGSIARCLDDAFELRAFHRGTADASWRSGEAQPLLAAAACAVRPTRDRSRLRRSERERGRRQIFAREILLSK